MNCPKCNRMGTLGLVHDALQINPGPEGPVHILGCTNCGWSRPTLHKGMHQLVQLRDILKERKNDQRIQR